ncbi:MAG: Fe-S cluster assembly protein SufD [Leptolinea sp.]|jgi:Fe-S cluster assembly protein SufD|nr:Fe-S cluster assembly protein SufD [Leptolinea sp.]
MTDTPIIIRRGRQVDAERSTGFTFCEDDLQLKAFPAELADIKKQAWEAYLKHRLPTTGEEAWRRTDLAKFDPGQFRFSVAGQHKGIATVPAEMLAPLTGKEHAGQIILNGVDSSIRVSPELKKIGVVFDTFEHLKKENPALLAQYLGKIVKPEEGIFPAMVEALARDGILLYVPENVKVEQPLHSLLWGSTGKIAYLSHLVVVLEKNAALTYIHETASPEENADPAMHAGVVEIHVGENAEMKFVELQSLGKNVWNFTNERVRVERNGKVEWIFGAIGSRLTKNFTDLDLAGEGATGKMSGFYFTNGIQHLDHDTQQNHLAPHTTSDLLFKGALLDHSRSVWQGMIYVAPEAQKTDGYQANRNLILSKNAHADSIPGLEILADDVRCTHGATVGKIDPDEVFYLRSRGVPRKEAERLIVEGFFDPIMQRIPFEGVRNRFQEYIHDKMAV